MIILSYSLVVIKIIRIFILSLKIKNIKTMTQAENTKHLIAVIEPTENCPRCEENKIREELCCYILDDDIEEALEIACENGTECSDCHDEEMVDNNRM